MSFSSLLLQQTINGLSLGAMYALLALGFTLIYGILELINFAHFNVFMIGSFLALWVLKGFGLSGQTIVLTGLPLVGVLLAAGNAMGGYVVTERMLEMFKSSRAGVKRPGAH